MVLHRHSKPVATSFPAQAFAALRFSGRGSRELLLPPRASLDAWCRSCLKRFGLDLSAYSDSHPHSKQTGGAETDCCKIQEAMCRERPVGVARCMIRRIVPGSSTSTPTGCNKLARQGNLRITPVCRQIRLVGGQATGTKVTDAVDSSRSRKR